MSTGVRGGIKRCLTICKRHFYALSDIRLLSKVVNLGAVITRIRSDVRHLRMQLIGVFVVAWKSSEINVSWNPCQHLSTPILEWPQSLHNISHLELNALMVRWNKNCPRGLPATNWCYPTLKLKDCQPRCGSGVAQILELWRRVTMAFLPWPSSPQSPFTSVVM